MLPFLAMGFFCVFKGRILAGLFIKNRILSGQKWIHLEMAIK